MAATRYTIVFDEDDAYETVVTDWDAEERDTLIMGDHVVTVYRTGGTSTTYPWLRIAEVRSCPID